MKRRVVITGLGAVTALGVGVESLWEGLDAGPKEGAGLRKIARFDASGFHSPMGGEAPASFSAKDYVPKHYRKAVKVMAKDVELAVAAASFAVSDAGLTTRGTAGAADGVEVATTYPNERMACHIGSGLIAADTDELTMAMVTATSEGVFSLRRWGTVAGEGVDAGSASGGGMNNLQPLWMLKYLPNMLACHVTIIHGLEGPSNTLLNDEASGLLCLGESLRVLQRGAADLGVAGSAESKINPMGLVRMQYAGRIAEATESANPREVVKPFSNQSKGGLVGEAGGIVVVEDEQRARARGVRVHARVAGFGAAHSLRPPMPERMAPGGDAVQASSDGLALAMRAAIRDAGLEPGQIDAVVPEGSGVRFLDEAEARALRQVFGARAEALPIVCLAPFVGGCAAGNGGVQAVVGAMCVSKGMLPREATVRIDGSPMNVGAGGNSPVLDKHAAPGGVRRILLCSMGLCGQNAAIVLEAV